MIDEVDQQQIKEMKNDELQYGNPLKLKNYLTSFRKMV